MLIYLLIINIIAFIMYGIDKWKAHRKQWRISEKMLLFLAVIGGSADINNISRTYSICDIHKRL